LPDFKRAHSRYSANAPSNENTYDIRVKPPFHQDRRYEQVLASVAFEIDLKRAYPKITIDAACMRVVDRNIEHTAARHLSNLQEMLMKLFKATAAVLFVATATLAVAQTTTEQSFAEQFKNMQSLQSFGTYTFKPAPSLGTKPSHPMGNQSFTDSFADMQAQSSNSGQWNHPPAGTAPAYANRPADPMDKESFAQMFERMQATSSNSDEWKAPAGEGQPAYATSSTTTIPPSAPASTAQSAPMAIERLTHALHAPSGSSSRSN